MRKLVVGLAACGLLLAACGSGGSASGQAPASGSSSASRSVHAQGNVAVLYAGSLTNLMEHDMGPSFDTASGAQFRGTAAGSTALVNEITAKTKQGDVFVSASTDANSGLVGAKNGDWETWYATFATSPLLIGYNPNSTFAADLRSKPWQQVITESGFRMGSTDPKLDPKGKLAAQALQKENLPASAVQVFPEEQLVGRLQSGQLDAGFFYSSESTDLKIPTVTLGSGLALKATYTVTVLNRAPNAAGGIAFVEYLLGDAGKALLRKHGLQLQTVTVSGDPSKVPAALHGELNVR